MLPGRFIIRVPPRSPAMPRESIALSEVLSAAARIASGMPGATLLITASVASGVTSRLEKPVPPAVRTRHTSQS